MILDNLTIAGFIIAVAAAVVFMLANDLPLHKQN